MLFVFTVANLAIGVALAPRYAEPPPDAIYGNNLAQQITSTFDVVICALSLAVLVAMLFTGPLAGYLVRRRDARVATASEPPKPTSPEPTTSARTDNRAASATLGNAENCSAQGGFDNCARGSTDGGILRGHHRAPDPAPRTDVRHDNSGSHSAL